MAETGLVVVTAPSSHRITAGGKGSDQINPPLQPIHEINKHACNNDNSTNASTVNSANFDTNLTKQHMNAFTTLEHPASHLESGPTTGPKSHTITIKVEPENSSTSCKELSVGFDIGASSHPLQKSPTGHEILTIIGDQVAKVEEEEKKIEGEKKGRDIEETIIENFAICAFASWEDLQDEINEKIALERAKQKDTATDQINSSSNTSQPSKKKRSRPKKEKYAPNVDGDQDVSGSQPPVPTPSKPKKRIRLDKKPRDRHKKSTLNGQPESSKPLDTSQANASTISDHKASNSVKKQGSIKESPSDGGSKSSKRPSKATSDDKSINTSSTLASTNDPHANPHTPHRHSTPQVHPVDQEQKMSQDTGFRDINSASRDTPHSSYGNNPHLTGLYDITAQTEQSMRQRSYPANFHDQFRQQPPPPPHMQQHQQQKQSDSQSQQPNKPNAPPAPQPPPGVNQEPYHQPRPFMYPQPSPHAPQSQQQTSPGMAPGNPYYYPYYPVHYSHPYYYPPPPAGSSTTNGATQSPHPSAANSYPAPQPPSYPSQQLPSRSPYPYSQYPSPSQPQPQSQYPPHPGMWYPPHIANPFSMYPPQQQQQQVISSTSRSMTAAPNPYGSPYIVTESTVSRQTSIMPPAPTALEQAAASSVASRFGHHPSLVHSMNHYGPSAAAAAAAAAAANYPSFHSHWPASPAPSASPASSSSSLTAKSHALQRWPQLFETDRRYKQTPPLAPNGGGGAYISMRPPAPFPAAAMFPPGPHPPF